MVEHSRCRRQEDTNKRFDEVSTKEDLHIQILNFTNDEIIKIDEILTRYNVEPKL